MELPKKDLALINQVREIGSDFDDVELLVSIIDRQQAVIEKTMNILKHQGAVTLMPDNTWKSREPAYQILEREIQAILDGQ